MRILFAGGGTGGHLYPGLAIARALVRLDPAVEPFFIGARRGIEREILPDSGFPHLLLDLHPAYRARPWQNWRTAAGLGSAWRALSRLARAERPAAAVGTGGYASGAALAFAAAHGIPVALQEQNSEPGLTTCALSRLAREIYLGYEEAGRRLRPRQGGWMGETGNPIEPPPVPRPDRAAARERWGFPREGGPVLLAVGGSQGARALNEALGQWLAAGAPEGLHVVWATGRAAYERFAALANARVRVVPYLSPIAGAYAAADLALTRAGALTLAELCAWGIPSILVPLPTAAADHQTGNARALVAAGAARLLPQSELTAHSLAAAVGALLQQPSELAALTARAAARARPDAAAAIARRVHALARGAAPS